MHRDPGLDRFFVYLNLFVFSMAVLVLGDNFVFSFLGWEGVGFCSYALICFWFRRDIAAVAANKAFFTNRVGGSGFLVAIFLIFASFRSVSYSAVLGQVVRLVQSGYLRAYAIAFGLGVIAILAYVTFGVGSTGGWAGGASAALFSTLDKVVHLPEQPGEVSTVGPQAGQDNFVFPVHVGGEERADTASGSEGARPPSGVCEILGERR
jgi:hypothetical protein